MMYYVVWLCVQNFRKVYNKDSYLNLSYSKEFETLLTSSKMVCSDMITCTAKQCFSKLLRIKGPKLHMDDLQMSLHV